MEDEDNSGHARAALAVVAVERVEVVPHGRPPRAPVVTQQWWIVEEEEACLLAGHEELLFMVGHMLSP
jgi:hypothetical protein